MSSLVDSSSEDSYSRVGRVNVCNVQNATRHAEMVAIDKVVAQSRAGQLPRMEVFN